MGNCFSDSKKSTSEIAPCDLVKVNKPTQTTTQQQATPNVRLCGSPASILTAYIRFALLYKSISPRFIPCDTPIFESETPTILRIGSESVSGSRETLLNFIESKFPNPPLTTVSSKDIDDDETAPRIVRLMWLQHKSLKWHLERMARWAEDLAKRKGKKAVDPAVGSPKMEVRKFATSYSQLLELMLEHAQMEERVVFPVLEKADRGNLYRIIMNRIAGNQIMCRFFF